MEEDDPLMVQLGQQLHFSQGQGFPLSTSRCKLGSKILFTVLLSHPFYIGIGPPVTHNMHIWLHLMGCYLYQKLYAHIS